MADIVTATNLALVYAAKDEPLTADHVSKIIDFKESSAAAIQIVLDGGDALDGTFVLEISLLCDPDTFCPWDNKVPATCDCLIWSIEKMAWRYARLTYTKGTDTGGSFSIAARGIK